MTKKEKRPNTRARATAIRTPLQMRTLIGILFIAGSLTCPNVVLANKTQIKGVASIISGDTLLIGQTRVKLSGIKAPVLGQTCSVRTVNYDCGRIATTALMDLTAGSITTCYILYPSSAEPQFGTCLVNGYNLSEGMVYTGWALPFPVEGSPYKTFAATAKKRRHGLWRGAFVPPWEWTAATEKN